jgi:RluA family pseudouridine synthase
MMTTTLHNASNIQVLYEDKDIILINKPGGLLSIADGYNSNLPHLKQILTPEFGNVWIIHRLDKDTSGVMVLARNAQAHRVLNESFRLRKIEKIYHGLVAPPPAWREMEMQSPLQTDADRQHRTRVSVSGGKPAHTLCRVIKWFPLGVLMEIHIHTGISHQIRAHLRAYDLALLGDALYNAGLEPQPLTVPRTMLHARQIGFNHPATSEWLSCAAPYPEDFRAAYTELRQTKALDEVI